MTDFYSATSYTRSYTRPSESFSSWKRLWWSSGLLLWSSYIITSAHLWLIAFLGWDAWIWLQKPRSKSAHDWHWHHHAFCAVWDYQLQVIKYRSDASLCFAELPDSWILHHHTFLLKPSFDLPQSAILTAQPSHEVQQIRM